MYALPASAEGDCYRCVPPDPGIAAAAPGTSESGPIPGTVPAEALHTFMLDSGASRYFFRDSTTLTPLPAPVPVRLADPSGGLVVARSSTILPCPAVPSGSLSGLHLPLFSTNVVAASAQVSASGQVAPPCSCRLLSHQTLLWNHRLGHPFLPRLRGMHSRLLVSGLLRSLPPLPPSPAPPCLPCVEGQKRAAPQSSSFPPTIAPLQSLHMDVWGLARVPRQGRKRYFLLVVDDYTRDTTVFPLRSKGQGWWFSSDLLRDFCPGEGILQSFMLPASPQQNRIAECRIGLVMEVAHTSMIHAVAPHFLLPFAVWYAALQLNLWPCVSLPETSPTVHWTGKVGDASVFRVWGSRAFVRDTPVDKLSAIAIPCVFLGFVPDAPGWQFYHPTLRRVLPSQERPAPSGVSQVDPPPGAVPGEEAVDSGAARGTSSGGAELGDAEPGDWGYETGGAETGGAGPEGVEPGGAEPQGAASSGGSAGASPRLPPQQLREWLVWRARLQSGATGAGGTGAAGAGGAGVPAGAGVTKGTEATGPGGAHTRGSGASGVGVGGAGVVDPGGAVQARPVHRLTSHSSRYTLPLHCLLLLLTGGLTERCEHASRPISLVRTARRVPRSRPPPVPGTHAMELRPSSLPVRVPIPPPPESSLPELPDPESDRARTVSPTVSRLLATAIIDPSFESAAASALVAKLLDFAAACHLDDSTALVAESESASPPSVGGECALGSDVLDDWQEDFECLPAAIPRFASMLLAPEGDPDAPDIPTPHSYAEAITGTYVDKVSPPGANIVDGMWIFRVKRPPGSPPPFKVRYVARGFSQRQGVDYFQTFSPTLKMTTLLVLQHVAAQRDYELHFLDFSTAFLQGSLHEEIWLATHLASLGRFLLTLRTTLAALGFYVLMYVNDLVFATADTKALALVKSELQKRHTCTDLGELRSYLGLQITRDRAWRTITLTQSHMVQQVLQCFGFQFSSPQPTPLPTGHSLSAPPSDESVEPSGLYPELVCCLMSLMTCARPDLAYPLSLLARYVAPGRHRKVHWDAAKRVLRYLCSTSGLGLVLGGRGPVVLTGHTDASWVDDPATQRSSQGNTFRLCFLAVYPLVFGSQL
ncbi:unnamed protein product [Closterium sp. NIES-54]